MNKCCALNRIKRLKIPNWQSEAVNLRRTDNILAKQKDKQWSTKHYTEN